MASLPKATTQVSETAGALAGGVDTVCLVAPVATNADVTPRQFGSASAVYAQHGYSEGVEYAALHAQQTRKPFIFVGIPIAVEGVVGRENSSGNSGTSVVSLAVGVDGVLGEHDGIVRVAKGGTVGTDQIKIEISLDGGVNFKSVRLGTANSYAIPFVSVTVNFGAGTLVAGDVVHTWHGTAPRGNADGWQAAREALAQQQKGFRSVVVFGDLQSSTEADALLDELEAYETSNERFIFGRASVRDRLPQAELSHGSPARIQGSVSLTFAEVGGTGDTITRSAGSWIADGFSVGDWIRVTGTASNNVEGRAASVTALVLTFDATDLEPEGPVPSTIVSVTAEPRIDFNEVGATGDTIVRSSGSWLADGFRVGDLITSDGTASNDFAGALVTAVTALTLTLDTQDLEDEELGALDVTLTAGQSKAVWMADVDAAFASVDDRFRLDLSAGRGRLRSPFSGWAFRRPAAWGASLREYQHDLHVATWKKDDGPTGFDLFDTNKTLVEWDDRVDGGAGSAARFTTFRTWANGPQGAFITQSLTRASEGSLLSQTHNVAVVNLGCTVVQATTENVIGRSPELNDDGTATSDQLKTLETEVNAALELALLQNRGEGRRASKAVWTASTDDILNVPEALLTGVLDLNLNGTIHSVNTQVRVRSGGQ
jgi:hypothetical protein